MRKRIKKQLNKHQTKIITFSDQAIVSGGNFLIGVILTRAMGLELYGVFALGWMIVLFASSLQQAFIINPMMTFAPQKETWQKNEYFSMLLFEQIVFSVLAFFFSLIAIVFAKYFFPEWKINAANWLVPITVSFYLMHDFFRKFFFTRNEKHLAFIIDFVAYFGQIAVFLFLWNREKLNLQTAFISIITTFAISITISITQYNSIHFSFRHLRRHFLKQWDFTRWLFFSAILQWFSGNYFILAAAGILGTAAVGALRIAQNIIGIMHVFFLAIENYVPIKAANIFKNYGKTDLLSFLSRVTLIGGAFTFFALFILSYFASDIISLVYGNEYASYDYILWGYSLLYLFVFLAIPLRFALRTLELTKVVFVGYAVSTVFCLLSANYIVERFHFVGVIAGLIISQIIMETYHIYILKREFAISAR